MLVNLMMHWILLEACRALHCVCVCLWKRERGGSNPAVSDGVGSFCVCVGGGRGGGCTCVFFCQSVAFHTMTECNTHRCMSSSVCDSHKCLYQTLCSPLSSHSQLNQQVRLCLCLWVCSCQCLFFLIWVLFTCCSPHLFFHHLPFCFVPLFSPPWSNLTGFSWGKESVKEIT